MEREKSAFQVAWEKKQANKVALKKQRAEWRLKLNGRLTSRPLAAICVK